ncbi:MAG: ABC transporter substrate-binding protein [Xanthobacteraceae bacterium]
MTAKIKTCCEGSVTLRLAASFAIGLLAAVGLAVVVDAQAIATPPNEKVLIRFTWQVKGEHAPLFVALDKGYFKDEGLDVELAEGSGAETVVKLVAQGIDNVGFGPATTVAEAISHGLPVQVVAVYQPVTPIGLMSFPDVPLRTPKDLEGRKLGLTRNESFANLFEPFAALNHVDMSKVTKVVLDYSSRNGLFMSRQLDIQSTFLNVDVPLMARKFNIKFNTMKVSDFGLKLLGGGLFVNRQYGETHPETISKLLRAIAKGYRDASSNPSGAAASLYQHLKTKVSQDILEDQLRVTMEDMNMTSDKPLGWQDEDAWRSNIDLLHKVGVIQNVGRIDDYYTNKYFMSAGASRK